MAVTKAKPRKGQNVPTTKMCTCCHQIRNLTDFYSNRDWVDQLGKDVWCKNCAAKANSKDELRKYFWENNREWSDKLWESSYKKAQQAASGNSVFLKTSDERRADILNKLTVQNVLKSMNINYKFVDNSQNIYVASYEDAKEAGQIVEKTEDPNVKHYSKEFNGDFKPAELEYLENYYAELDQDFGLEDTDAAIRDNAKKAAKASLTLDITQNKFLAGQATIQDLNNAIQAYNSIMSLGNFAASKRKPGDSKAGLSSWAETTAYLEANGHPCIKKIEWPKDIVDQTIDNLSHIVIAIADDNGGETL